MVGILFWVFILFVIYTYFGYPALLVGIARLKPARKYPQSELPSVSLIIAAYNEQAVIAQKIENSLNLDYPKGLFQILVAADGSSDRTPDIVREYAHAGVELVFQPIRLGKFAAISRAIPHAKGKIVVFSDTNNQYSPEALIKLVTPFSDPRVGAVSGAKIILEEGDLLGKSEGLYWLYESFIKSQETRIGTCTGVCGEILAIRKELFTPTDRQVINDDFFIGMQVINKGFDIVYVPQALSIERISPKAHDEITRRSRIVAGRYQSMLIAPKLLPWRRPIVIWQIISHKYFRPLVPFAMLGMFLTALLSVILPSTSGNFTWLYLSPPINWLALGSQVGFYFLAFIGNFIPVAGTPGKALYVITFFVNSNIATFLGFFRYLHGSESVLWQRVRRPEETE